MSGIAGILETGGQQVKLEQITLLTSRMQHLGPDAENHWTRRPVALGHCLLRTTPESCFEDQPLANSGQNLVIVWDGRLDNRPELRQKLISQGGYAPQTTAAARGIGQPGNPSSETDPELVLQSYACWGQDCVSHLAGDFAFVIWDEKRQWVYCARDHIGARPFYFTQNSRFFAFASEEEILLAMPQVPPVPNEKKIAHALLPSYLNGDPWETWLEHIRTLPPAHWMTISVQGARTIQRYWQPEPGETLRFSSDRECEEAFLEVFGKAVHVRMRSNGNIAAMISGGLDSASLLAMARRQLTHHAGKEFHTYSAISDNPSGCIESQCILSLTSLPDITPHFLNVPSFSGMLDVEDLLNVFWNRTHPVDHSILLPAMMCLAAHRDGQRVMLHGMGGDQTMEVHGRYIGALMLERKWHQARSECWSPEHKFRRQVSREGLLELARNAWAAYAPSATKKALYQLRQFPASSALKGSLVSRELATRLKLAETIRKRNLQVAGAPVDIQREQIRATLPPYGHVMGLNGYNRVAGRFGIELRDPWSDKGVYEFCLRLPLEYKVRLGWPKYLVRTSFAGELDQEVLWRRGKEHLGWLFVRKLVSASGLQIDQQLSMAGKVLEPWVEHDRMTGLVERFSSRHGDLDWDEAWRVLALTLWLQRISS